MYRNGTGNTLLYCKMILRSSNLSMHPGESVPRLGTIHIQYMHIIYYIIDRCDNHVCYYDVFSGLHEDLEVLSLRW